jgi:hypothetical protein
MKRTLNGEVCLSACFISRTDKWKREKEIGGDYDES